jgi:outer membrane protein
MRISYKKEFRSQDEGRCLPAGCAYKEVRRKTAFIMTPDSWIPTPVFTILTPAPLLVLWLLLSLLPAFFISGASAQEPLKSGADAQGSSELGADTKGSSEMKADTSGPKPLVISVEDAVLLSLNRNRDLKIKILEPQIAETVVQESKAPFDIKPFLNMEVKQTTDKNSKSRADILKQYPELEDSLSDIQDITTETTKQTPVGSIGFSKLFSTGTKLDFALESQYSDQETDQLLKKTFFTDKKSISGYSYSNAGSITLTQPLLKGLGKKVNLSLVQKAEMERQISVYELQQYAISLVSRVQKNYWDLVLAEETLKIQEKSLELSERQKAETQERISLGKEAESEIVFAQAEVAAKKGNVIDAKSELSKQTLNLLYLLNPDVDSIWEQKVQLTTPPVPVEREIGNVQEHVAAAMRFRPAINQAYLNFRKGDLEVVRTQNGLLPKLDFFISLKQMASGSEFPASLRDFDDSDYTAGLNLSRPLGNTGAKAQARQAGLDRLKYQESIEKLKQEVQVEVRKAIVEIDRCREKIVAMQANRSKQEEKLKVEQEKFRLGRSTNLLVFTAQRDLTEAQVNEVTAIIDQIKAFIDLQVSEGTLLQQWSIETGSPLLR